MGRFSLDILFRAGLAVLASLFVFMCTNGGVSIHGWLGALQVGAVCGIVAGALAPNAPAALTAGLIVGFLGGFAFVAWFIGGDLLHSAVLALTTGLVALGVRVLLDKTPVTPTAVALAGVALVIGGLWWVTMPALTEPQTRGDMLSSLQVLKTPPVPGEKWSDGTLFRAVVIKVRAGTPYYEAFRQGFNENGFTLHDPNNVIQVRTPTLFYVWAWLPDWPASLVWSLLGLASVACVACIGIAREVVDPTLGLGGAAAIGAYTMASARSPNNVSSFELWGGLMAVLVLYGFLRSVGPKHHKGWALASAGVALFAFASRELMIFLPVAAVCAAFFSPAERRRFDLTLWLATLGTCVVLWAAHLWAASRITKTVSAGVASTWLGGGGLQFMLHGISYNSMFLSAPWVAFALAVMGLVGASQQSTAQAKAFALIAGAGPVFAFLFVGNAAISKDLILNVPVNYWGAIVMPMLIALAPAAFALLPALRCGPDVATAPVARLPEPATSL